MPLLDQQGWKADNWTRLSEPEFAGEAPVLVRFADFAAFDGRNTPLGIEIGNDVKLEALRPLLARLDLIAIAFPSFSDGRGFSIAKALRNAGYCGTLRAVGPLIADQFAYALACGFDEVELPEAVAARQPAEIWVAAAKAFRATYQRSHSIAGPSILDRRKAAKGAFSNEVTSGSREDNATRQKTGAAA